MKPDRNVIKIYSSLVMLMIADEFDEPEAIILVHLALEHVTKLRSGPWTLGNLRDMHREYTITTPLSSERLNIFARAAFRDLAPHMHSAEAREVFRSLMALSDMKIITPIFAHVASVRLLGADPRGFATVTFVTNSLAGLRNLLEGVSDTHVEAHVSFPGKPQVSRPLP